MKPLEQSLIWSMFCAILLMSIGCKGPSLMTRDTNYIIDINHIDSSLGKYAFKRVSQGRSVSLTLLNLNKGLYAAMITKAGGGSASSSLIGLQPSTLSLPGQIAALPPTSAIYIDPQFCPACQTSLSNLKNLKTSIEKATQAFTDAVDTIGRLLVFNNKMMTLQKKCGLSYEKDIRSELDRLSDAAVGTHNAVATRIDSIFTSQAKAAIRSYNEIQQRQDDLELLLLSDTSCKTQNEKAQLKDFTPRMKDMLKRCSENYTRIQEYLQNDQIAQIVQLYQSFTMGNYTLTISDTEKRKDRLNFDVTLTPRSWIPCDPATKNFAVSLKVVRWKIDFSTGVFFNYGNNKFRGNYYYIDSSDKIARLDKNDGRIIPAFGALMHIYRRSGTNFDWGGEVGASLNTDLSYANFYLGGCFMINAENQMWNRIVFSAGLALRRVKELSRPLREGDPVDKNLSIDQLVVDRYRTGAYIGITYNLKQH